MAGEERAEAVEGVKIVRPKHAIENCFWEKSSKQPLLFWQQPLLMRTLCSISLHAERASHAWAGMIVAEEHHGMCFRHGWSLSTAYSS